MNLGELRKQIQHDTEHVPNAEAHRDALTARINRAIVEITDLEEWVWRRRSYRFAAFADLKWVYADWGITQAGTPVRHIRVSGFSNQVYANVVGRRRGAQLMGAMLNNPVFVPDSLRRDDGLEESGWGTDAFLVERVDMGLDVKLNPTGLEVYLDPRFSLGENPKNVLWTGEWTLEFRQYALPRDCATVNMVRVIDDADGTGRGPALDPWSPEMERGYDLDPQVVGTPTTWAVQVAGVSTSPGAAMSRAGTLGYPHQVSYGGARLRVPEAGAYCAVDAVAGAPGNDTRRGHRLQYCWTWRFAGMESGPSPVAEVNLPDDGNVYTIAVASDRLTEATFGRVKVFYRRIDEGQWRNIGTQLDPSVLIFTDTYDANAAGEPLIGQKVNPAIGPDEILVQNTEQQFIKLYPRPTKTTDIEVWYWAKPRILVAEEDAPELPTQYQAAIVHHAVAGICRTANSLELAATHEKLYEDKLKAMRQGGTKMESSQQRRSSSWRERPRRTIGTISYTPDAT